MLRTWYLALLSTALLAVCKPGDTAKGIDTSTPTVVITPADLDDAAGASVMQRIPAGRSVVVQSGDGAMTLRIQSGSVARDTQLTIARLRADRTPRGVIG